MSKAEKAAKMTIGIELELQLAIEAGWQHNNPDIFAFGLWWGYWDFEN